MKVDELPVLVAQLQSVGAKPDVIASLVERVAAERIDGSLQANRDNIEARRTARTVLLFLSVLSSAGLIVCFMLFLMGVPNMGQGAVGCFVASAASAYIHARLRIGSEEGKLLATALGKG